MALLRRIFRTNNYELPKLGAELHRRQRNGLGSPPSHEWAILWGAYQGRKAAMTPVTWPRSFFVRTVLADLPVRLCTQTGEYEGYDEWLDQTESASAASSLPGKPAGKDPGKASG